MANTSVPFLIHKQISSIVGGKSWPLHSISPSMWRDNCMEDFQVAFCPLCESYLNVSDAGSTGSIFGPQPFVP